MCVYFCYLSPKVVVSFDCSDASVFVFHFRVWGEMLCYALPASLYPVTGPAPAGRPGSPPLWVGESVSSGARCRPHVSVYLCVYPCIW